MVTKLARLSLNQRDLLVCAGDFNRILIYENGVLVKSIPTTDWTSCICVRDGRILVGTTDEVLLFRVE
jgi:hypothetical protein